MLDTPLAQVPTLSLNDQERDPDGFARECRQGRDLGFTGKTVIHPAQIDPANAAYGVTDDEADEARALIAAWDAARAEGRSVATHQGALVEQMHVDEAQDVLTLWEGTRGE